MAGLTAVGRVVQVGVIDSRGWLLLQERDDRAPVDPDKWSLVGGGIEPGESPADAARRELAEETGVVRDDLSYLGYFGVACDVHGRDEIELFVVRTQLVDRDVACHEGRQIVFVPPEMIADLDLTAATRALYRRVLAA